ncbi:MAG TPA: hypothetical protein PLA27_14860, partial [Anaerolineales bacterium]|nr:hypothetical protein [Anaerolineales bacterium]
MNWIIGIAMGLIVGYLLDREIYFYEGARLGPRARRRGYITAGRRNMRRTIVVGHGRRDRIEVRRG